MNAALPIATPAIPQLRAVSASVGTGADLGTPVGPTTVPFTPAAVETVASPERTLTATFFESKVRVTFDLGAIVTAVSYTHLTLPTNREV